MSSIVKTKATRTPMRTEEERNKLVEQYLPLVRHVAARLPVTMPTSLDRDDFYSVGVVGLIHAASHYDPSRGATFKTFAYTAVRGAILDEIRRHDPVPRNRRDRLRQLDRACVELRATLGRAPTIEELADRLDASPDDLDADLLARETCRALSLDDTPPGGHETSLIGAISDHLTPDPGNAAADREDVQRLAKAIGTLPETERKVVVLYHYEDLYLKEIGGILGVTESRVSQILTRATARLQLKLRDPHQNQQE